MCLRERERGDRVRLERERERLIRVRDYREWETEAVKERVIQRLINDTDLSWKNEWTQNAKTNANLSIYYTTFTWQKITQHFTRFQYVFVVTPTHITYILQRSSCNSPSQIPPKYIWHRSKIFQRQFRVMKCLRTRCYISLKLSDFHRCIHTYIYSYIHFTHTYTYTYTHPLSFSSMLSLRWRA